MGNLEKKQSRTDSPKSSIIHLHRNNKILATLFTPPTLDDITVLALAALTANILMMELAAAPSKKPKKIKNDGKKRCQRRRFMSDHALQVMQRDYLGIPGDLSTPLFGQEFKWMSG
jgi:hypothetical protein